MSKRTSLLIAIIVTGLGAAALTAAPMQWQIENGGNGHWYEVAMESSILFNNAKTAASASSYLGTAGHLATVDLPGEATFIYNNLTAPVSPSGDVYAYWLGAEQEEGADAWYWVTGEQVTSEQMTFPSPETWYIDHFASYGSGWGLGQFVGAWWTSPVRPQDTARTNPSGIAGYVIEYPVPEPACLLSLLIGGATIAARGRRPA